MGRFRASLFGLDSAASDSKEIWHSFCNFDAVGALAQDEVLLKAGLNQY